MSSSDQAKWDDRYRTLNSDQPTPCQALIEFAHLLPKQGVALDLAAGLGGNAIFLAKRALVTSAWDISPVAIEQLQKKAGVLNLNVTAQARDVLAHPPKPKSFDVIVVSRFLHRAICPQIASALRPAGLLFYQTFIRDKTNSQTGPSNPDYLLERNELLSLFTDLNVISYREEGTIGDTSRGLRNEAWLVAQRHS